ncbi:hypothetical protein JYB87_08920 [Shewanella avicenniae]|uniref:Site-specific recombinase XerD n=1 Tax=Shewanella avicenniae TaxID=2814294 RepID=A0ABX7QWT7_9GAMM|nr:hypothetical protein [Shewanella avicenniae]QSX35293.1 hypothetical protein JYB87_08920 [Shewanella avicenniae]
MELQLQPLFAGDHNSDIELSLVSYHQTDGVFNQVDAALLEYQEACRFLRGVQNRPNTFRSYRRDVEKLLLWSWFIKQASVTTLRPSDLLDMVRFYTNPPPVWCNANQIKRFIDHTINPAWRPCIANRPAPTQSSIKAMLASISAFYQFLVDDAEIAMGNPALSARKRSIASAAPTQEISTKLFTATQVQYLTLASRNMAQLNPIKWAKARFAVALLFHRYLRISEISRHTVRGWQSYTPTMGCFQRVSGNWFFHIPAGTSKNNKSDLITVPPELLEELKLYRRQIAAQTGLALPDLPAPEESIPLLPKILVNGQIRDGLSVRAVRYLMQEVFDFAAELLLKDAQKSPDSEELIAEAHGMKAATVHWLRHSGISTDLAEGRNTVHVRDDARHVDLSTTNIYTHTDLQDRAASAKHKHRMDK